MSKLRTCAIGLLVISAFMTVSEVSSSRTFFTPERYLEGDLLEFWRYCLNQTTNSGHVTDLVLKAFGTLRDVSGGLHDFGSTASDFFGSDSFVPILRESRQARELIPNNDGTGVR